jgi:hypothetical protein
VALPGLLGTVSPSTLGSRPMRPWSRRARRGRVSIVALCLGGVPAALAQPAPTPAAAAAAAAANAERLKACVASHEQAQVSRNGGDLLAAREAALSCSQASCPAIVQADCAQWFGEIDRDVPSAVVRVRSGELDVEARLFVDGQPQSTEVLGRALELNPGRHHIRVEPRNAPPQERELLLAPNEKGRAVHFDVTSAAPARKLTTRPIPTATFVLGGTALALVAGGAVLGSWALSERNDQARWLKDGGCTPYCTEDEVASIEHKALAADVFFGLGVAAGAAALLSYIWRPEVTVDSGRARATLSVAATSDTALVGMRGAF